MLLDNFVSSAGALAEFTKAGTTGVARKPVAFWAQEIDEEATPITSRVVGIVWQGGDAKVAQDHPNFVRFVYQGELSRKTNKAELKKSLQDRMTLKDKDLRGLLDTEVAKILTKILAEEIASRHLTEE